MRCQIYSIPHEGFSQLGIMPRPRGADWLENEIRSLRQQKVDVLVSLLTAEETAELCLDEEEALCRAAGIPFLSFPIPDRSVPASCEMAFQFSTELSRLHREGKKISYTVARVSVEHRSWRRPYSHSRDIVSKTRLTRFRLPVVVQCPTLLSSAPG